jgi:hypothetical protein
LTLSCCVLLGNGIRIALWEIDGALSPRAWLAHRAGIADSEAAKLVKDSRLVDRHHEIKDALVEGEVTVGHVEAISRVMSKGRQPLLDDHAAMLVEQAKSLSLSDFATVGVARRRPARQRRLHDEVGTSPPACFYRLGWLGDG